MHRHLLNLSLLSLLGWTHIAQAASSTTELTVSGRILPRACTPTFSNGGQVDFGNISRQDLNQATGTRLPPKYLTVTISCNAAGRFVLSMRDNRDGTAHVNSEIYYGLGLDAGGNKIGLYSLSFDPKQTVVDDLAVIYGTESTTGGAAWRTSNSNPIYIGASSLLGFTDVAGSTAGPSAIQNLTTTVTLEAVINATQNLDLTTRTAMDGSGTMDLEYL